MSHLLMALLLTTGSLASSAALSPASQLDGDEKKAWTVFFAGAKALQDDGDRSRAAGYFEQVAKDFPQSRYADDSRELGVLLRKMLEEEKQWNEPANPETLPLERKIAYYTYHLRDVNCYQRMQPGMCYLLSDFGRGHPGTNAAMKLKALGEPAIPALIQLLEDRRPTRSVGYWRDFAPSRTILRFQDAAMQILNELLPAGFYSRSSTGAYFSTETPEARSNAVRSIQYWYQRGIGKSELEKKWLAVEARPGIYQLLGLLRELALQHNQRERVISTLEQMTTQRSPLQLPQISELMCELGDNSKVGAVVSAYIAGKYDVGTSLPDDGAAGSNAQDSALRQVILYGTDSQRVVIQKNAQRADDPLRKDESLFLMLTETATEDWRELPKIYDRERFPLHMLVGALTNKTEWRSETHSAKQGTKHVTIRRCDGAADAIQKFTRQKFGYDPEKSTKEKDAAIARIMRWWNKRAPQSLH